MKIRGCPSGPPPPSQETFRALVQFTGCLWMRSIAAYGRGYRMLCQPLGLYRYVATSSTIVQRGGAHTAYLIFHDRLLKPRPNHGFFSGALTPAPNGRSVRRLHHPSLLALFR